MNEIITKGKKKICGYNSFYVFSSEYNYFGKCKCFGCLGKRCNNCAEYIKKFMEQGDKKQMCKDCLNYKSK